MEIPQKSIVVSQGQLHRLTIDLQPIRDGASLLNQYFSAAPRKIAHAFVTGAQTWHLTTTSTGTIAHTILPSLTIRTKFSIHDGALVPTWGADPRGVALSPTWTPPHGQLYFALKFATNETTDQKAFLFQVTPENDMAYLPLSNHHDDGELCLGTDWASVTSASIAEHCEKALQYLDASNWKADALAPTGARVIAGRNLFRFAAETAEQMEFTGTAENYWRGLVSFSNANLEGWNP